MARKIRQDNRQTPIIIATAHTETAYLLKAIELQLIKYIIKPITSSKLKEVLHLAYEHLSQSNIIMIDNNRLYDTLNRILLIKNNPIKLSKNEILLLDLLAKNHQRVVTYQEIENLIWCDNGIRMDALRSLVRGLRQKMQGNFIENVSGIGYRCQVNF